MRREPYFYSNMDEIIKENYNYVFTKNHVFLIVFQKVKMLYIIVLKSILVGV